MVKDEPIPNKKEEEQWAEITCPKCSSRLSLDYLNGNERPLCETNLRSDTILGQLKSFEECIAQAKKQYQ